MNRWFVAPALAGLIACGARTEIAGPTPPIESDEGGPTASGGEGGGGSDAAARVLLFGGAQHRLADFGFLGDTWTWSASSWSEVASEPSPRLGTAMARLGDRVVLFGGLDSHGAYLDDTWEWDGAWHRRDVPGPSARGQHAMAAFGDVVVLQGGHDDHGDLVDTWEWNGSAWSSVPGDGPDVTGGGMASIGDGGAGVVALTGPPTNDLEHDATWRFDGAHWSIVSVPGPPPRTEFSMASLGVNAIVFGGYAASYGGGGSLLGDTWLFDGQHWKEVDGEGPSARAMSVMASADGALLLYGGLIGDEGVDDAWRFDGAAWTPLGGGSPGPRYDSAMASLP